MKKLLVFLHGLKGDADTWQLVPNLVQNSLGREYEAIRPVFDGRTTSPADHERSAGRILTILESEHSDKDLIYLIGYSDGGLVVRELCRKLLLDPSKDGLTKRIAASITVGSPLEGTLGLIDSLLRTKPVRKIIEIAPFKKLAQIAERPIAADKYADAIAFASKRNLRRPLHYHIQIEGDRVVAPLKAESLTVDDILDGFTEGTHKEFVSTPKRQNGLANALIKRIRDVESLLSPIYFTDQVGASDAALPPRVLLLGCSNRKRTGGTPTYLGSPLSFLSDGSLRAQILAKRTHVFSRLTAAKIEDAFKIGSNRIHEAPNQSLEYGPDFGGVADKPAEYLPAYERYYGRSYKPIPLESWRERDNSKMSVLIMSGLYGLIDAQEYIQEYDVHLTDTDREAGVNLKAMWMDLYTRTVANYVERAYDGNAPVKIFDLLSDEDYVASISWPKLPGEKCSVYHLTSKTLSGKQLLPCAGLICKSFLNDPGKMDGIKRGVEYNLSDFGVPPATLTGEVISFESRVNISKSKEGGSA
jgi:pimeloyl-ACP methyl ester carboxylesterase